ncbi:MAG TPA: hypothetical protein VF669_22405 [Tepidisphaeraceae bacterium]|jgi:hypothetical protein
MNVYQSVHNDPVNHIDPLGLETKPEGTDSSSTDQSFADWARTNNVSPDQPSISTEAIASPQAPEQIHYGSAPPVAQQALGMLVGAAQSLKDKLTQLAGTVFDAGSAAVRAASGGERGFANGESTTNSFFHTAGAATEWGRTLKAQGETDLSVLEVFSSAMPLSRPVRSVAPNLNILNPEFTPNAGAVVQNATDRWAGRLASDPALAKTVLSPAEYAAAQNSCGVARMAYGNAVERLVAKDLQDPLSSTLVRYTGGSRGGSMPDFIDLTTGGLIDITTPGQVASKADKWYGPGLVTPTYSRPADFTQFP